MKDITIIMPFLNECEEPQSTIDSIYQTAHPDRFEIIAIDDCSNKPSKIQDRKEILVLRNKERIGVDACRQLGAELATTKNLFIIDAHMRFPRGWLSRIVERIEANPKTLWCTTCMGLGYGNMDLIRSRSQYRGADIIILNGDGEVLEPKWRSEVQLGDYEIPCVLGANYGVSKEWFIRIRGLRGLKMWGSSEPFMSLKTWMAGGSCKIASDIKIGHKFRSNAPYSTNVWQITYNKIFLCKTILPENLGDILISHISHNINKKLAEREINKNKQFIDEERKYYQSIFTRDIFSICEQWNITIPKT